ncbi:hypothetical protein TNIN_7501 [Trichonephila inaurata madagascariensis]|uniref:BTB domain-containing protein n=1 Tax=Trichonephila inaurata madagascariensis TaxID=2747483 RepID=A0A8X6X6I0_9ARAC|nr:hypothetical protein TNIN_7501 [Trichonephila inaurata madagascariensis]
MKDSLLPNDRLTIHCSLRKIQEPLLKDFVAVTKIGLKQSVFEWSIPNWSRIQLPATCDPDVVEAPYITHVTFPSDSKPLFRLYLCRNRNEDVDLRLDVVKLDPNLKTVLKSRITLLEDEDKEAFSVETTHRFDSVESLGATCYSSSALFPSSDVPNMLNDVLTLQCILAIPTGAYKSTIKTVDHDSTEDKPTTDNTVDDCFKRDLENLLKKVPRVLNQMIEELDEMREEGDPAETEIDFDDMDGDTLKRMVQFLYTERIENIEYTSMLKLLAAAQKFKVWDLKERCSEYLRADFPFRISLTAKPSQESLYITSIWHVKLLIGLC